MMTSSKTEQVKTACATLFEHADFVARDANAVGTLAGLASRFQRAAAAASARDQEQPIDPATIYRARRAVIDAAAQRRRPA
jgi:hypothetical protein